VEIKYICIFHDLEDGDALVWDCIYGNVADHHNHRPSNERKRAKRRHQR
jgi:hypothetical protein